MSRIKDLKGAPQWLKCAQVENENVEIANGTVIWLDGEWLNGEWHGGKWYGGLWHDGVWLDGEWHGGVWLDGVWRDGLWYDGSTTARSKYIPLICGDKIKIGCKAKTIPEWDEWFAGTEEYKTKRGTPEFKMIYAHYRAVREYYNVMKEQGGE